MDLDNPVPGPSGAQPYYLEPIIGDYYPSPEKGKVFNGLRRKVILQLRATAEGEFF